MKGRIAAWTWLHLLTIIGTGCCSYEILVRHPGQLTIPQCYSEAEHCSEYSDCCDGYRSGDPSSAGITCENVHLCTNGTCSTLHGQYSVYMVSRCPTPMYNRQPDLQTLCHSGNASSQHRDPSNRMTLPVFSNRTGRLYKNGYCASCHGELASLEDAAMQLAHSALKCSGPSLATCEPVAILESRQTHVCYPSLADDCQGPTGAADPTLKQACDKSPTSYQVCEATAYRNVYCRMCRLGWYAPSCQQLGYPLWQLRSSLDGGLLSVYVSFRPLDTNLPGRGFGLRGNSTDQSTVLRAISLYATHAVSMTALATLLGVYLGVSALRNRPGFCLCSHAACVLVLEALAVATRALQPTDTPCLIVLLLSYFCLTAAFAWAGVFGLDLVRCIISSVPAAASSGGGGNLRCLLTVWTVPLALTGCLGGLHARLGLFDLDLCQFAPCHKWLMLALSLTPLGLALTFNFSIALAVCVVLRRRGRETSRAIGAGRPKSSTPSGTGRLVGTTVRVSVAMGVAWLPQFCLSNLPTGSTAAAAAGEHLAALHGVLLALCFCCSRRVRALLLAAHGCRGAPRGVQPRAV